MNAEGLGSLVVFFLLNTTAAYSGARFKPGAWYASLRKPSWNPPKWLFPVVWGPTYVMITIAGWLVWEQSTPSEAVWPMVAYGVQLLLNAGWSVVFFGLRQPGWGLVEISVLWLTIAACIVLFYPISPLASALLIPYLAWGTFAGTLTATIWRMNRGHPQAAALSH